MWKARARVGGANISQRGGYLSLPDKGEGLPRGGGGGDLRAAHLIDCELRHLFLAASYGASHRFGLAEALHLIARETACVCVGGGAVDSRSATDLMRPGQVKKLSRSSRLGRPLTAGALCLAQCLPEIA